MIKIPPEIDALMWQLAEDGGPVAQAEFEARHTRYGPELTRRIRMVAELRQAGKAVAHRPKFTPRPVKVAKTPHWAVGASIGLAVVAVGAVAFVAASWGDKPARPAPVVIVPPNSFPAPIVKQVSPEPAPKSPVSNDPLPVASSGGSSKPESVPEYMKVHDVQIADTNLTTAITLVAAGTGLQVMIAPGFKDRRVTLEYHGLNTIDTLHAMGEQYGFSVLEEQDGHVLVVPARAEEVPEHRVGP